MVTEEKINLILNYSLLAAKSMLTLDEASLMTGLKKSYLYQLTSRKEVPFYKPNGKNVFFDKKELEAWMRQNRMDSVNESKRKAAEYIAGKGGAL